MFESLTLKLQSVFQKLRGRGTLSKKDVSLAMREIRRALLQADVNFKVVKDFVAEVEQDAIGSDILSGLNPGQQVVKLVHQHLIGLLGEKVAKLKVASKPPTIIMLVGLQGSGKTTACAKLARLIKQAHRFPLLVAADIYRPAAIDQLEKLGRQLEIEVFSRGKQDPVKTAQEAVHYARQKGWDTIIIDTAGRLHIDEALMRELKQMKKKVQPTEILLIADAMTGQDAVNIASSFDEQIGIDGVILTKMDGDARGGAAISIRAVTGKPIKFIGTGEKLEMIEQFHPDRMASRILGMGDVLTFIEKAEQAMSRKEAEELERKIRRDDFTLEDFMGSLKQLKRMGPLEQLLDMIPGMGKLKALKNFEFDENEIKRVEAIIGSMTKEERVNSSILNGSRRRRIALGSGTRIQDVNALLKQFGQVRKMMKQMKGRKGSLPAGFKFLGG
ncbi:MAG: signal recognition particle protein [Candidatus Coatesbacteria bacterium]|nr:MAG: signal recognition particle protein [Candidatus Coatesbacteria bacterium]